MRGTENGVPNGPEQVPGTAATGQKHLLVTKKLIFRCPGSPKQMCGHRKRCPRYVRAGSRHQIGCPGAFSLGQGTGSCKITLLWGIFILRLDQKDRFLIWPRGPTRTFLGVWSSRVDHGKLFSLCGQFLWTKPVNLGCLVRLKVDHKVLFDMIWSIIMDHGQGRQLGWSSFARTKEVFKAWMVKHFGPKWAFGHVWSGILDHGIKYLGLVRR